MQIVMKRDLRGLFRAYINTRHEWNNPGYEEMLDKVSGMTLDVETDYLFVDQFNVGPIPGVSPSGMRIMERYVDRVIDDIRFDAGHCWYCGACVHNAVPDGLINTPCPKCGGANLGYVMIGRQGTR